MSAAKSRQERTCSLSGGTCPYAERCAFAERNGMGTRSDLAACGRRSQGDRLDMCAVSLERGFGECRLCPDRRRCKDVWRCWRREKLDAGSPLVEELRAIDERVAVKEQYRVDKTGWRPK